MVLVLGVPTADSRKIEGQLRDILWDLYDESIVFATSLPPCASARRSGLGGE